MTTFDEIARRNETQPVFRMLYVGSAQQRSSSILKEIRSRRVFDKVETLKEIPKNLDLVRETIRQHLKPESHNECTILVFDLGPDSSGQSVLDLLEGMPRREPWGSQVVGYVLAGDDSQISFNTFVEAVARDIAGIGDASSFLASIQTWCRPFEGAVSGLNLGLACQLNPSWWIRGVSHDYTVKVVGPKLREQLEEIGLWESQCEIDVWQDALRNVLVFPYENKPACPTKPDFSEKETEIQELIDLATYQLLVPKEMETAVRSLMSDEFGQIELVAYGSREEAVEAVRKGVERNVHSILVSEPGMYSDPAQTIHGDARPVPTVWVADSECELSWDEWRKALGRNVVGSYRTDCFLGKLSSQDAVLTTKLNYWKAFCFRNLGGAIRRIVDLMCETHDKMDHLSEDRLVRIFRCAAQVQCAGGLYFENIDQPELLV